MDINKRIDKKLKKKAKKEKVERAIYTLLTPIAKIEEYILKKQREKSEAIWERGKNMSIDEATKISVKVILEDLIKHEDDIDFVVAEYVNSDYCYNARNWLLSNILNDKSKEYKMLKSYLYKGGWNIDFHREFTEAIYDNIAKHKGIKVEWVTDKERYGYYKSRNYEKTLIIGLEESYR